MLQGYGAGTVVLGIFLRSHISQKKRIFFKMSTYQQQVVDGNNEVNAVSVRDITSSLFYDH